MTQTDEQPHRWYCARLQFPGLLPFYFGTVSVPLHAGTQDILDAVEKDALEVLPQGFKIIDTMPGQLVWIPEEQS